MQTKQYEHSKRIPSRIFSIALTALSLLSTPAFAQANRANEVSATNNDAASIDSIDTLSSDRPGFVESSTVMKQGRFQLESGVSFAKSKQDAVYTWSNNLPYLLRYGSSEHVELRLESDGWTQTRLRQNAQATTRQHGYSDLSLGLKWHVQDGDEITGKPAIAWLAHLDLATGSGTLRGSAARPSLRMVAEWELAQDFSFAMMPGWSWEKNDAGNRFNQGLLGFSLSHAMNAHWNTYIELSGEQLSAKHNGGSVVSYGAGASCVLTRDIQVDFSATKLWSGKAPNWQAGLGFSLRF